MSKPATPAAQHDRTQWIEIFRAGDHTDANGRRMSFSTDHLDEVIAAYDPQRHEAPVVVGHPRTDDPALGWIGALKREGDVLLARESAIAPAFEEARQSGAYKKRSASFYLPDSPGNPTPGKLHLRHVGWLGGMPPAIKGMADMLKAGNVAFQDDGEGVVEFNDMAIGRGTDGIARWGLRDIADTLAGMRDHFIASLGVEQADRILPRWRIESIREAGLIPPALESSFADSGEDIAAAHQSTTPDPEEDAAMSQQAQDLADAQAKLEQDRQALEQREAEFNERQRLVKEATDAARAIEQQAEAAEFADALVRDGKLLPKNKAGIVALYQVAQGIEAPLAFGEGEDAQTSPAVDIVRNALSHLPKVFDFAEKSGDAVTGVNRDDSAALAKAALEFQESEAKAGRTVSVSQAVAHIHQQGI
ncbi:MAG: hypothetical protein Q4G71_10040 [Pseudomonadota bacterium]|nr:hypothetical protein [Pseudomonadota bacterium]